MTTPEVLRESQDPSHTKPSQVKESLLTIHPTAATSTPAQTTVDGHNIRDTTAPVASAPLAGRKLWIDGQPIHPATPEWIRRRPTTEEPQNNPTTVRPVGVVVARDSGRGRCGSCSQHETVEELRAILTPAEPEREEVAALLALVQDADDIEGSNQIEVLMKLLSSRQALRAEREGARLAAAELSVELERTEGDLAVALQVAAEARDQVRRVAVLHHESPSDPGWCLECRTAAWPCPTSQVVA